MTGPYFPERIVTGENYCHTLDTHLLSILQKQDDYASLLFMHDGAPPHYATRIRNLLDTWPGGWVGRLGTEWTTRSCDLAPVYVSVCMGNTE